MSISTVFILDRWGKVLISRNFRGVEESDIAKLMISVTEKEEEKSPTPVIKVGTTIFAFVKYKNLYLVASIPKNGNISMVFVFLHKFLDVLIDYLKVVEEESVRDNFVVIYELLDEMLDFGYPQTTDSRILMEYITQESKQLDIRRQLPPAVTNAVSWRSEGIKYRKNEVFLDITESVDLLANNNGTVVHSEVSGSIRMLVHLSGMPEVRLGLNDRLLYEKMGSEVENAVDLDEVKFHQCVRLCKFEVDRDICFIPPDGGFELMSYRLSGYIRPPVWVSCVTELHPDRKVHYTVKVQTYFTPRVSASDVDILIPVPCDVDSPLFDAAAGVVKYVPERSMILWSLKTLQGAKELSMVASFRLPSVANVDREPKPPVRVKFKMISFNISGLKVRYCKVVDKSGYKAMIWVRNSTEDGCYEIRQREVIYGLYQKKK